MLSTLQVATGQDHRLRLGRQAPKGLRGPVVDAVLENETLHIRAPEAPHAAHHASGNNITEGHLPD